MTTLEMFIEAAKALQNDPAYLKLDNIRQENEKDQDLVNKVDTFNTTREQLTTAMSTENPDKSEIVKLNNTVRTLYTEIMEHEGMVKHNEAQEELDELIKHIQAVLTAAINGQDPATAEPPQDCAGSCSGCSGCA